MTGGILSQETSTSASIDSHRVEARHSTHSDTRLLVNVTLNGTLGYGPLPLPSNVNTSGPVNMNANQNPSSSTYQKK